MTFNATGLVYDRALASFEVEKLAMMMADGLDVPPMGWQAREYVYGIVPANPEKVRFVIHSSPGLDTLLAPHRPRRIVSPRAAPLTLPEESK